MNRISKTSRFRSENTGKSIETVALNCNRDYYMDAAEAIEYGICDKIYNSETPF